MSEGLSTDFRLGLALYAAALARSNAVGLDGRETGKGPLCDVAVEEVARAMDDLVENVRATSAEEILIKLDLIEERLHGEPMFESYWKALRADLLGMSDHTFGEGIVL